MLVFYLVLYILAAVFLGLAVFSTRSPKVNLVALGLLLVVLVLLFQTLMRLQQTTAKAITTILQLS